MAEAAAKRWSLWSIAIAGLIGMGATTFRQKINDNSFLWHVRAGDAQIDAGAVLTSDPFTFTALGRPWRTQSWLADLLYSWLDERIGLRQVPWIVFACWIVFVLGALAIVRGRTRSTFHTAIVLAMTATVTIGFFNPRPVVFSFGLFSLLILADRHLRLRWTIPFIMWIWVSVHGSFFIGAAYLLLQAARNRDKLRIPALGAAGLTSVLSAHGLGVIGILLSFAKGGEALKLIQEWAVPDFLSAPFISIPIAVLLLIAAGVGGSIGRADLWLIVPFLLLAFDANRTVPAAWLALLTLTTVAVTTVLPELGHSRIPRLIPLVLGALLIGGLVLTARPSELDPERFPVEASHHLSGTRLFSNDGTGGFLVYSQWPERLIYVDDRAELLYDEIPEMVGIRGAEPKWQEAFERRGFDEALVSVEDPIGGVLRLVGWMETFSDENWIVLVPPA
jgi:hypothetical protein